MAWQRADELASLVYRACKDLPPQHHWLVDQILRCAVSVPANIAEGHGRGSLAELTHFVDIARGSLAELEYFLHFIRNEALLTSDQIGLLESKQDEASRLLFGFWRSLKATSENEWDHTGKVHEDASSMRPTKVGLILTSYPLLVTSYRGKGVG